VLTTCALSGHPLALCKTSFKPDIFNLGAEQIKDDLGADIKNAQRCDVDDFIKHFLYLVLEEGKTKNKIDNIQSQIEKLQHERYYPNAETSTTEETVIDQGIVSEEEEILVKERAKILDNLLERSLQAVLPLANDETICRSSESSSYYYLLKLILKIW
jgi:hypothetical protein